jgi:hypothetical protein
MALPQAHVRILELAHKKTLRDDVPPDLQEALTDLKTAGLVKVEAGNMIDPQRLHLTRSGAWHWLEAKSKTGDQGLPANEAKVKPEDVPAALREGGQPNGQILTASYLGKNVSWDFSSTELTKANKAGELTYRLKIGRAYAYLYAELCTLRDKRAERKSEL